MESRRLLGKVAMVTGAGGGAEGGIGSGIARQLAREGATVAVQEINPDGAELTVRQLKELGVDAFAIIGDVADPERAEAMIQETVQRAGQLDILVNNAGIGGLGPAIERMTDETWLRVFAVDLTGPFNLCKASMKVMKPRRFGRIVNIASIAAKFTGFFSGAPYTAAKSGLLGFTRHLALEAAPFGITVNCIMPGGTLNTGLRRPERAEVTANLMKSHPMGRIAMPEDHGIVASFLATDAAGYVNGVCIPVDGGTSSLSGDFAGYKAATGKDAG